jgi:hypothetical protein
VLDIDNFITELRVQNPRMALMMDQVKNSINQVANVLGIDSTSFQAPPTAPQAINVKAAGGIAHVTITDGSTRGRALNYFVEHDTDPAFPNPHVAHLVASRGTFLSLPAKNDAGDAQSWYFRAYSMYPGSTKRSSHIIFGGFANATPVDVGGTTQLTPLPSTGAGTASTTGQQGGQGFGSSQFSQAERGIPA